MHSFRGEISHEIMHHMNSKKEKTGFMALKIKMAKTYDKVEWSLLSNIMKLHGFGDKFVNMIHECISSTLFWILINGSPFGFSTPRGLRQVDLMSSVLFTIYFDLLSRLITRAESQQDIHGVKIS